MDINRALLNALEGLVTEEFAVTYVNSAFGIEETHTSDVIDLLGWILPSDEIVSVERA